ncbi:MAG: DUF3450 domain-containing protein [Desulfatitalea sp.]|nr:DUF3450 domain-containing protein [Desulfatitalea sp.]NNK01767.1 DUF3450 domain-containing protein [Desulfatitalea sp.]
MLSTHVLKRCWILLLLCGLSPSAAVGESGRQIEQPVRQSIAIRQQTQQDNEHWRQERENMVTRFEALQQQHAAWQDRKAGLDQQIDATRRRVAAKEKQLADIEQMTRNIKPFLAELVTSLKARVADDPPFLAGERGQRIEWLERLMVDPDVALSEIYRKVMEALQVEAEYGFTIETYQESIMLDGQTLLADIFRLGRLGLYCLSLDRRQVGFYNPAATAWQPLAASHRQALSTAIAIAAKQQPVELLTLPLGRLVIQ